MAFDRSKFKATDVSTLQQQEDANKTPRTTNQDGRVSFHQIPEGTSKWRIMPAHPDCKSFMAAKQVHWLPQEITYEKNGKEVTEIKRRPLFNSRTHGSTSKDIIEEYISFVMKQVYDEIQDPEERKNRLFNLTNWKVGVRGRVTWIVYAQKIEGNAKTLGRLELPGLVKDKMNELAITEDQSDDVIQTDPFTDPDTGKAILITYDKSQKEPVKKYATTLEWRGNYTLTDEKLEELMEADSLEKIYKNSYKRKDFEKALEGLRIFDEDNGYNAFAHDEWLDICELMDKMYPEDEEEVQEPTPKQTKTTTPKQTKATTVKSTVVEYDEEEEEDDNEPQLEDTSSTGDLPWEDKFDAMDRDRLRAYIKENGLSVMVLKKYSDEDLRGLIREEVSESDTTKKAVESTSVGGSAKSRLASMKNRLAN